MEAAYDLLLIAARLFAVVSLGLLAWWLGVSLPIAARRRHRRVDESKARVALLERETRNALRSACTDLTAARESLDALNRRLGGAAAPPRPAGAAAR